MPDYNFDEIAQRPLLTRHEEAALFDAVRAGDEKARERLAEANLRLVLNITRVYRKQAVRESIPVESLFLAGRSGLELAIERFDPNKPFRFSTYATHWIRQAIGRALDDEGSLLPQSIELLRLRVRAWEERRRLRLLTGVEPTLEQLADALNVSVNSLRTAVRRESEEVIALVRAVKAGDDASYQSLLAMHADLTERIALELHHRHWRGGPSLEDLVLAGKAGLLQAAQHFDPDKSIRFATYAAHWVRLSIGRA